MWNVVFLNKLNENCLDGFFHLKIFIYAVTIREGKRGDCPEPHDFKGLNL